MKERERREEERERRNMENRNYNNRSYNSSSSSSNNSDLKKSYLKLFRYCKNSCVSCKKEIKGQKCELGKPLDCTINAKLIRAIFAELLKKVMMLWKDNRPICANLAIILQNLIGLNVFLVINNLNKIKK